MLILAPLLVLATCMLTDSHPTDRAMAESFAQNRPAFEELLSMIRQEPRITEVAPGFILVAGKGNVPESERSDFIPPERWDRYRALFDATGLEGGVARRADGSVVFERSSAGLTVGGSNKAFLWAPRPPQGFLFADSDRSTEGACNTGSDCTSYKQIGGDWYVMYDRS